LSANYILPPFCNKSRVFRHFHDYAQYIQQYVEIILIDIARIFQHTENFLPIFRKKEKITCNYS